MDHHISFIKASCKRCGKELVTLSQSLLDMNEEKKKFGVLCSSCTTQNEQMEILNLMGTAIRKKRLFAQNR